MNAGADAVDGCAAEPGVRRRALLVVMAASGCAGLGYQIVWTQQCALWLGHETAAVLAVVAAFFGGLAAGAFVLGRRIARSARPALWYAVSEFAIGAWALVLLALLEPASARLLTALGPDAGPLRQWTVAFAGTFLLLSPATAAMGATLPAMERVVDGWRRSGESIAALYAANTFGAVAGVLGAAFWLVPAIGLGRTAGVCAALNALCGALALRWARADATDDGETLARADGHAGAVARRSPGAARAMAPLAMLAVTGLLGIGYEVVVVRVLSQVAEDTVYTFALLLAVYLVGTAAGAALYARAGAGTSAGGRAAVGARLLRLQAIACLLGTASLWGAETIRDAVARASGGGMGAALVAEAALAVSAFALPTLAMGALFSHLCIEARARGRGFASALAWNTLGAAAAPALFGVALAPAVGSKAALLAIAAGYAALGLAWPATSSRASVAAIFAAIAGVAALAPPLAFVDVPDGGRVVEYREGAAAAVSVVEDAGGVERLRINNRQQEGSSATLFADARQALIPMLLHPAPQRALFLGLGTGVTAAAAAFEPGVSVDAVELVPEVIAASARFTAPLADARAGTLRVVAADARRYVRTTAARYDVIVADNYHPARSGSAALYTVEHFRAIRARLADGGVFCQWLPLHQLDVATLRSIVRSFVAANPQATAVLATYSLETPVLGLVARAGPAGADLSRVRARLAGSRVRDGLARYGLADEYALLGTFVAGPESLRRFAAAAPANTDDRPVVAYLAPRITYAPDAAPRERLLGVLRELDVAPSDVLASAPPDAAARMTDYWRARSLFLDAGRDVPPSRDPREMLARVREPLLRVLRTSADFRPAYDPLLRLATAIAPEDPAAARLLLAELAVLQPARAEAADALARLDAAAVTKP